MLKEHILVFLRYFCHLSDAFLLLSVIRWWLMPRKSLLPTAPATSGATCPACPGTETSPQLKLKHLFRNVKSFWSADLWHPWPTTGWTSKDAWSTVAPPRYVCVSARVCDLHVCFLICVCGLASFHPLFAQMFSSFTVLCSSFLCYESCSAFVLCRSEAVCFHFKKESSCSIKKRCMCLFCLCVCLVLDANSSLRSCVR